jgi:hypothetical protein
MGACFLPLASVVYHVDCVPGTGMHVCLGEMRRSEEHPRRNSRDGDPSTEEFGRSICAVVNMGNLERLFGIRIGMICVGMIRHCV